MFDHFDVPPAPDHGSLATLIDVTLRDGGFEVDFHWPTVLFSTLPAVLGPLGIDIVELGYIGGVPLEHSVRKAGVAAHLTPSHIAARSDCPRLAAMVHPSALHDPPDLRAYATAGLSMIRLVYHPAWFDAIVRLAQQARDVGLKVSINIALASRYPLADFVEHAERINVEVTPDVLYVADTCGAMIPDQVARLVGMLKQLSPVAIGFHAHDFLTLAYANAISAAAAGAEYIDVSLLGLGRGGGNLQTELVLLRHRLFNSPSPVALDSLLESRAWLAGLTGRTDNGLLSAVCGVLNLTPVEEHSIVQFASEAGLNVSTAALWLVTAIGRVRSVHAEDLEIAWRSEVGRS